LQEAREEFHRQGLGLAAISYDSEAILRDFSERRKIQYPLLADSNSDIIRSYGVLSTEATGVTKGMARPGYFYISPDLIVKEKFFETAYTDRDTANNLLLKLFPHLVEGTGRDVSAHYINLRLYQSDKVAGPGSQFTVTAEVELPPGTHVYAPGVKGYKPIQLSLDVPAELKLQPVRYPEAKVLYLPAIQESVPVFEGKFRVFQDVVVSADRTFIGSLGSGKTLTLQGHLFYQACDSTKCYLPQKSAVSWHVEAVSLDSERSPQAIQHR
jgi:AhpC/TSA family/Disulphide bond corrector protein DsbC